MPLSVSFWLWKLQHMTLIIFVLIMPPCSSLLGHPIEAFAFVLVSSVIYSDFASYVLVWNFGTIWRAARCLSFSNKKNNIFDFIFSPDIFLIFFLIVKIWKDFLGL